MSAPIDLCGTPVSAGDHLVSSRGDLLTAVATDVTIWKYGRAIACVPYGKAEPVLYLRQSMLIRVDVPVEKLLDYKADRLLFWANRSVDALSQQRQDLRERRKKDFLKKVSE